MAYNLVTKQPTTIAVISVNMSSMDCNLLPELKQNLCDHTFKADRILERVATKWR